MLSRLKQCTDTELLELVLLIMSKPESMFSARDHTELDQINNEFISRGHADLQVVK